MRIPQSTPRTRTSPCSSPSTSPSRSRTPTATAKASRACRTCSAAASWCSASATLSAAAAAPKRRIEENFVTPTLAATPGDLSLVIPKRILDGIIEMIYALDKIAPGTANDDTLLYGVEVKFYNMEVEIDDDLQTKCTRPVCHRRRLRCHALPVPRLRKRRTCGAPHPVEALRS